MASMMSKTNTGNPCHEPVTSSLPSSLSRYQSSSSNATLPRFLAPSLPPNFPMQVKERKLKRPRPNTVPVAIRVTKEEKEKEKGKRKKSFVKIKEKTSPPIQPEPTSARFERIDISFPSFHLRSDPMDAPYSRLLLPLRSLFLPFSLPSMLGEKRQSDVYIALVNVPFPQPAQSHSQVTRKRPISNFFSWRFCFQPRWPPTPGPTQE